MRYLLFLATIRLRDDLVHLILKITVKEACLLLRSCQLKKTDELDNILSTVPVGITSAGFAPIFVVNGDCLVFWVVIL